MNDAKGIIDMCHISDAAAAAAAAVTGDVAEQ
jgi:hypothetical protein